MSYVIPFTFNAVELCVVTINEKPWTRAREVRNALEYGKATKTADVVKQLCSRESFLKQNPWIGQKTHKNMIFTSMRKVCTNWFLEVNSLRQKTSESIVVT